jgi:hypothetical protein
MVLEFLKQLVAGHPTRKMLIEALPYEDENENENEPSRPYFQEVSQEIVEMDYNKYNIYLEPRGRSLLVEVNFESQVVAIDYFPLKDGVVNWKLDHDYDWMNDIMKLTGVKVFEDRWVPLQLECAVCMRNEQQCYTMCGHVVCLECLGRWWHQGKNSCPLCRSYLNNEFMLTGNWM